MTSTARLNAGGGERVDLCTNAAVSGQEGGGGILIVCRRPSAAWKLSSQPPPHPQLLYGVLLSIF